MPTKAVIGSFILGVFLAGCASTSYIQQSSDSYAALNEHLEGRRATIILLNPQSRKGRIVSVDADSVRWTSGRRGLVRSVASTDVHAIEIIGGRGKGAVRGLAVGVVVGGGIYAAFAARADAAETLPEGFGYVGGGLTLGVLSAVFSTIVGTGIGTPERYVLNETQDR